MTVYELTANTQLTHLVRVYIVFVYGMTADIYYTFFFSKVSVNEWTANTFYILFTISTVKVSVYGLTADTNNLHILHMCQTNK